MFRMFLSLCVGLSLGVLAGCGGNGAGPAADRGPEAGHDGHDHAADAEHSHPTAGPHGGHLIELGEEEYHAELLHDEATHTITIHVLDAAGKKPVPVQQDALTLQLFQDGKYVDYAMKPAGDADTAEASEFNLQSGPATDALLHTEKLQGRLRATINGKQYTGVIEHVPHDHDGHAHAAHG